MKKRISALVLSSCLLAGCAGQGAAATGETAAPSQAVPTAAPQSLTVNGLLDTSAAVGALELYALLNRYLSGMEVTFMARK